MLALVALGAGMHAGVQAMQAPTPGGYIVERDADVARNEPGTHNGGGQTVGYSFFRSVPNLKLVFRKRAFKPGSGVGHHVQKEDEIYYVLSGTGTMTLDGKTVDITPGHRSAHAPRQLAQSEADGHRGSRRPDQLRGCRKAVEGSGPRTSV